MESIIVSGATSMIGVALIEEAIKNHVKVLAIVRNDSKRINRIPKSSLINIIPCDVEQLSSISQIKEHYDVFYHFAWNYTDKSGRNNAILQAQNINATLEAVKLAKALGCKKFIGAGSQAEYGRIDGVITPLTSTNPEIPYGMAKYAAGRLAQKLCEQYDMNYIWGRIFSVYGRYDNEGTMLNYAVDQFICGKVAQFSAATQMWNYLNEHDAGAIFYLLGTREKTKGIYCIAHPESRPLKEYIMDIARLFDAAECSFAQSNEKLVGLNADVSKLASDIQFCPSVTFEEGIKEIIDYRTMYHKNMKLNTEN